MSSKKKIVFFIPQMVGGGAEKVTLNLMKLLDRASFEIHLITLSKTGPFINHLPEDIHLHILNVKKTFFSYFKLRQKLNTLKPDIVFSSLLRGHIPLVLAANSISQKPFVILRSPNSPKLLIENRQLGSIMQKMVEAAYRRADLIIAQTPEMKEEIAHYHEIPHSKIEVLQNPLDIEDINVKTQNAKNPFDPAYTNVVAAGRLIHQKGFDILISSFSKVIKINPQFRLHIIGEDVIGERKALEQLVSDLDLNDYVTFWGYQTNPYPFYLFADLYVLSSRWEGLPNTVLETLYLGTPVVSTRCIPYLSTLIQNGENGFLVDVEDIDALADAILHYQELEPSRMTYSSEIEQLNRIFLKGFPS